jgi:bacterioferritin-associated ferredoxin
MKPVFIFTDQVREVLDSGKKEIEIPKGARISAAAYDLIKDHKIRIVNINADTAVADAKETESKAKPAAAEEIRPAQDKPASEKASSGSPRQPAQEFSADELEDIVDRVIARFKQLKGLKSETSRTQQDAETEKNDKPIQDEDLVICRCEEITRGEIIDAIRNGMRTLNGVKRITRAGMGLCQGQTCQRLVAQILTEELRLSAAEIDPTTARGPVRPLRLEVFANS